MRYFEDIKELSPFYRMMYGEGYEGSCISLGGISHFCYE